MEATQVNMTTSTEVNAAAISLLRLPDVLKRTALGRTALYENVAAGAFPRPVKVGRNSAWLDVEVQAWIRARVVERDGGDAR